MLVYTVNDKKYYLAHEGNFTEDFKQVLPLEYERVSDGNMFHSKLFRLKCFNTVYITESKTKGISLSSAKSDENLITQNWKYLSFLNSMMSVGTDTKLSTEKTESAVYPHPDSYIRFDSVIDTKLKELYINGYSVLDLNLDTRAKEHFDKSRYFAHNYDKKSDNLLKVDVCFQKLLCQPEIRRILTDAYATDFHLTGFVSIKTAKSIGEWGTNYPYQTVNGKLPAKTHGVQIMILLDDYTEENGGHEVKLYSHSRRSNPTKEDIESTDSYTRRVVAKKGSVVVMLGKTWSREKNMLDSAKAYLLATFGSIEVSPKDSMKPVSIKYQNEGLQIKDDKMIVFSDSVPLSAPLVSSTSNTNSNPTPISVPAPTTQASISMNSIYNSGSLIPNLFGNSASISNVDVAGFSTFTDSKGNTSGIKINPFTGLAETQEIKISTGPTNISSNTSSNTTNNPFMASTNLFGNINNPFSATSTLSASTPATNNLFGVQFGLQKDSHQQQTTNLFGTGFGGFGNIDPKDWKL